MFGPASWQTMELVILGTGNLVGPKISRRIVNEVVGFFIGHPVLITILSRPFMYMSMMTI